MSEATDHPVSALDGHAHVLVVDDDTVIRKLARTLLEKSGFTVWEAAHGRDALEHLETGRRCDLVVLDINMPGLNGHEVLRLVRGNAATAGLPVVMLTGCDGGEMEADLVRECVDVITKPLDPTQFVARIKAALR